MFFSAMDARSLMHGDMRFPKPGGKEEEHPKVPTAVENAMAKVRAMQAEAKEPVVVTKGLSQRQWHFLDSSP